MPGTGHDPNTCLKSDYADNELKTAMENNHTLAVTASNLNSLASLTENIKNDGFNNLVINFQTGSLAEQFQINTIARRMAIKNNYISVSLALMRTGFLL